LRWPEGGSGGSSGRGRHLCLSSLIADGVSPRRARFEEAERTMEFTFPQCRKCHEGDLVPLSDFGSQGASIEYKAWVCTNPNCLYNVKIRNGDIIINEPVSDGSLHNYRRNN
jgi:hypothetical protein